MQVAHLLSASHTVAKYDMSLDATFLVISPWTFKKGRRQIHDAVVGGWVAIGWLSTNLPANP